MLPVMDLGPYFNRSQRASNPSTFKSVRWLDCRIVFAFEPNPDTGEEMIVLVDLGTHDEVY